MNILTGSICTDDEIVAAAIVPSVKDTVEDLFFFGEKSSQRNMLEFQIR